MFIVQYKLLTPLPISILWEKQVSQLANRRLNTEVIIRSYQYFTKLIFTDSRCVKKDEKINILKSLCSDRASYAYLSITLTSTHAFNYLHLTPTHNITQSLKYFRAEEFLIKYILIKGQSSKTINV